mmetsp:Transcript_90761/g.270921  ORF Transcript_90761/g.270921 Transcript_90761/m.270921 type:complete len:291 (-) Transcript_90761:40-912(-)
MMAQANHASAAPRTGCVRESRGPGRLLGGALFAAAQHAVLFDRVLLAWDRSFGQRLKRWSLAAWAQAAREARGSAGWALMVQMLEEEVERLGRRCDEKSQSAEVLQKKVQQERARRCRLEQMQGPVRASPVAPRGQTGGACLTPGATCLWPSTIARASSSSASCSDSMASGDTDIRTLPCLDLATPPGDDSAGRLASSLHFLFVHALLQRCGTLREAYRSCCDQAGWVSRRAFTGLVVEVLGQSPGATAELLAEVVGVVWPKLDAYGSGAIGEADFLRLSAGSVMSRPGW